jgi:hypothetical protein
MPADWMNTGIDVVVGGGAGAIDQVIQNQDETRRREDEAAGKEFSMWKAYGTYFNYGIPILAILGVAFDFLKGDWATRAVVAGSQLAGRKVTYTMTKATQSAPWRRYNPPGGGVRPPVPQSPQKPGFEKVGID